MKNQSGIEIVACVAGTVDEAERFAQSEEIAKAYATTAAMLAAEPGLGLLVVAAPDHVHAPAVAEALQAGVPVYCEKPIANDAVTAHRLADLGDAMSVPATVGYSFRFNPAIQALKRDLRAGRLGTPWLIELAEHNPQFHPHGGKSMNWKGDPGQAGGGSLFEYGSHVVDMAAWLLGPIARVSASLKRVLPGARLDDISTLQMEFESSAMGMLVASWVLTGGFPGIRIRLHGSERIGEVWVDDRLPGGQRYTLGPAFGPGGADQELEAMGELRSDAATRHMAAFIATLRGETGVQPDTLPDLRQAAHVQDILQAALEATAEWRDVRRPANFKTATQGVH